MAQVNWSPRAIDDVAGIAAFIAEDSESYASAVTRQIFEKTAQLSEFPKLGRIVPEFGDEDVREVFVYSYRIIYRVYENDVIIGTVIHGKRLLDLSLKP